MPSAAYTTVDYLVMVICHITYGPVPHILSNDYAYGVCNGICGIWPFEMIQEHDKGQGTTPGLDAC